MTKFDHVEVIVSGKKASIVGSKGSSVSEHDGSPLLDSGNSILKSFGEHSKLHASWRLASFATQTRRMTAPTSGHM